jgi:hypothetical protein
VNVATQFEEAHPNGIKPKVTRMSTGDNWPLPMFASTVTMNGLRVTITSIIDITEFFLRKDGPYKYVLTGKN